MNERTFLECRLASPQRPVDTETTADQVGARALTLITTGLDALNLQLYTTYVSDEVLLRAAVAEVLDAPDASILETAIRELDVPANFLLSHLDVAVRDHLQSFCQLARRGGHDLEVIEASTTGLAGSTAA